MHTGDGACCMMRRCFFCRRVVPSWCVLKMIPSLHGIRKRCSHYIIFTFRLLVKNRNDSRHLPCPSVCCAVFVLVTREKHDNTIVVNMTSVLTVTSTRAVLVSQWTWTPKDGRCWYLYSEIWLLTCDWLKCETDLWCVESQLKHILQCFVACG